ncbi:general substrate transporter [Mariannaea sp. PMI_226]|nr:general substrate transporter [Mariannaea sp. PMI_226]
MSKQAAITVGPVTPSQSHTQFSEVISHVNQQHADIITDAKQGTESEQRLSFLDGVRLYPKAIGWSLLLSTAVIMEGFDTALLGNFFAYPSFQKKFGHQVPGKDTYQLSAAWQTGLIDGALCGQIIGLAINGWASERFGYRKTMIVSLVAISGFIFVEFFSTNLVTLLVGEILVGVPLGVFQTLTTVYASEVCPVVLRSYLTSWVNICWFIGAMISTGVLRGCLKRSDDWGYRIPFALQWIWPVPIILGVLFAPESPWWLVRKGRLADAERSVRRLALSTSSSDFSPEKTVAMMVHTDAIEKETVAGASYIDCFRSPNLRRTAIVCTTWAIQRLCGSGLSAYSTYFFEQAGLSASNSFSLTLIQEGIGMLGTFVAGFMMLRFGRRTLYIGGLSLQCILLFLMGFLSLSKAHDAAWGIAGVMVTFQFVYGSAVGPICYSLVTELSPLTLRTRTVVLARISYNTMSLVNGVITPRMINPTAWNWGAKAGFFWGGSCIICILWCYFFLPEPRGRTYAELDALFERGVSARKFKSTKVDVFS